MPLRFKPIATLQRDQQKDKPVSELNEGQCDHGTVVLVVDDGGISRLLEEQKIQQLFKELQDKGIAVLCADPETRPREVDTGTSSVRALAEVVKTLGIARAPASDEPYWNRYRKKTWR